MKTTVTIEWDKPQEQAWLCPENIAIALHAYCKNTEFKVTESLSQQTDDEIEKEANKVTARRPEESHMDFLTCFIY